MGVNGIEVVYIAGPLSARPGGRTQIQNVHRAIKALHELADRGFAPLCPHLFHYADVQASRDYEEWMSIDFALLRKCDALFRLEGESSGADREVEQARLWEIPIACSFEELADLALASQSDRAGRIARRRGGNLSVQGFLALQRLKGVAP